MSKVTNPTQVIDADLAMGDDYSDGNSNGHSKSHSAKDPQATLLSATFTGFAEAEIDRSIGERFEAIVQRYPNQIAVQSTGESLTYAELNQRANTLAHALIAQLGEGTEPVVLLFDHTTTLIVALMAVLKAGKAYLVLDQTHPPDRLAARLADLQARLLVTSAPYGSLAALFPYALQERGVQHLGAWLRQEAITFCDLTPTAFRQIVTDPSNAQGLPHVRVLYLGGERVVPQDVAAYKRYLEPTAILVTGFATTETCSEVCLLLIDKATTLTADVVPLGYALPSMAIDLLDEAGQPVGPNEVGEIAVKSRYLALGYWQRPALTAERFLPDPSDSSQRIYLTGDLGLLRDDGALLHKGRKDFQLKIRGNRVDIGEIEAALLALAWVKQAAVNGVLRATEEYTLIAYLVLQDGLLPQAQPTVSQLRQALAARLPSYMLPTKFIFLADLPLTASDKIDRTALPAAPDTRPLLDAAYRTPRTPTEQLLVTIWEDILAINSVGIDDNFFELGGHSLLTMRLMMQIEKHFAVTIPPVRFFERPTIAQLAPLLAPHDEQDPQPAHPQEAKLAALSPALAQLYAVVGVPGALSGHHTLQGGRRWYLIHHALQTLPHGLRLHVAWQLTRPPVRGRLFRARTQLIRQFLAHIQTTVDKCLALDLSLHYGLLHKYSVNMVRQSSRSPLVDAATQIEQTRAQGRGVLLLHSHTTLDFWWKHLAIVEAHIGGVQDLTPHDDPNYNRITDLLFTRQLDYARQILQQGGVAQIAADGIHGQGDRLMIDFHGRRRPFITGFAELALATNAQVIPVCYSTTSTGGPIQALGAPLDPGDDALPHTERVERLVTQYVAQLSQLWAETPWLVPWYQMERHLAYPPSDSG